MIGVIESRVETSINKIVLSNSQEVALQGSGLFELHYTISQVATLSHYAVEINPRPGEINT
jgi:hypothetical protein